MESKSSCIFQINVSLNYFNTKIQVTLIGVDDFDIDVIIETAHYEGLHHLTSRIKRNVSLCR